MEIVREARERLRVRAAEIRRYGRDPDELYVKLYERGFAGRLDQVIRELADSSL
ncbi:hypothetical protein [Nonomuraea gerenzanensis]|uniref:Uncharacterized protein n=1 Tax=Nonomuraea gerenzanensis TaxID=93944 RepID=A0A1M4DX40_9ACTN|nr:hypothetical protein [Nonomuraea gerenzanensis]UBU13489.1 hypothetical protein LCN96_00160 [Nonomuraea gerenzanensis]SBO91149.1 hypothetical protein BN4615_P663 [Nonomuraea gerenzanensis]